MRLSLKAKLTALITMLVLVVVVVISALYVLCAHPAGARDAGGRANGHRLAGL